jgi:hypothetical protein
MSRHNGAMQACGICDERRFGQMVLIFPCQCAVICLDCLRALAMAQGAVRCPFCAAPVDSTEVLTPETLHRLAVNGGAIYVHFLHVTEPLCEALYWASSQEQDAAHRLPHRPAFVRVEITELDGTVGAATYFLEEGRHIVQTARKSRASVVAWLNQRRTADGRYQCMNIQCLAMQAPGAGLRPLRGLQDRALLLPGVPGSDVAASQAVLHQVPPGQGQDGGGGGGGGGGSDGQVRLGVG